MNWGDHQAQSWHFPYGEGAYGVGGEFIPGHGGASAEPRLGPKALHFQPRGAS